MSVIPKPAPTRDAVLTAVSDGRTTVPALIAATGRTRCAVNHAVCQLRARGLVTGTSRDGSLAVTTAGRAALAGDTSSASKAGGRPTTSHLRRRRPTPGLSPAARPRWPSWPARPA